jgi:hypothetical protein
MMRAFGRLLIAGWTLIILSLFALFIFPQGMAHFLGRSLTPLKGSLIVLVLASALFGVLFLFRAGMRRTGR